MKTVRMAIKKLQKYLKCKKSNCYKGSRIMESDRIYRKKDQCGNSLGGRG